MRENLNQIEDLFGGSLTPLQGLKPRRGAGWFLLIVLASVLSLYLLWLVGVLLIDVRTPGFVRMYMLNPVATSETIAKLVLLIALSLIGAYNTGIRREAVWLLATAQFFVVAALLWLYFGFSPGTEGQDFHAFLLPNAILDVIPLGMLLILAATSRTSGSDFSDGQEGGPQSRASRFVGILLAAYGIIFVAIAATTVLARFLPSQNSILAAVGGGPDPLQANIVSEYGTLGAVSLLLCTRVSLRKYLVPVLILCLAVGAITSFVCVLNGDTIVVTRDNELIRAAWVMPLHLMLSAIALGVLLWLRRMQYRIDFQITALAPGSAECVISLHRTFREAGQNPGESARNILRRVDEYIVGIRGKERGIISFPFWMMEYVLPLLAWLRPPFSMMSRDEQRWMMRRYVIRPSYERARALIPALADAMFMIGDSVHSLLTFSFFSSSYGQAQVGYLLPNARERLQPDIAMRRPPESVQPPPLPLTLNDKAGRKPEGTGAPFLLTPGLSVPQYPPELPSEVDYCIIGSGAAGGVLAYRLAAAKGKGHSICVLEKGGYYSPVQHFHDDELQMVRTLYADGGLQSTQNLDFTILQGQCVGGSTVINNALCFEMPEVSKDEWRSFGIDADGLSGHYDRVAEEINIGELTSEAVNERVEDLFSRGVERYNVSLEPALRLSPAHRMRGNFCNCVGCGLCNIGCRRLRKLSVLETFIPWAEARGVRVVPDTVAVKCSVSGNGARKRVDSVLVRRPGGDFRELRINKALVVAAGAIASSRFLMRSQVGGQSVGKGLACNYAFPIIVEFNQEVDAFDGLQMTMFAARNNHEAVFETTFNPPGTQSVMIAQYFDHHEHMMQAYRKSMVIIALVGSDPSGFVTQQPTLLYGRSVQWQQTPDEIERIKRALTAGVGIARAAGATRIRLPLQPALEIPCDASASRAMEKFNLLINDRKYFRFATPHPQGGNMMASDKFEERVVGADFRVRDCDNLFVCDASVFPRGIRVNPQWTIMALASAAGERIAEET